MPKRPCLILYKNKRCQQCPNCILFNAEQQEMEKNNKIIKCSERHALKQILDLEKNDARLYKVAYCGGKAVIADIIDGLFFILLKNFI